MQSVCELLERGLQQLALLVEESSSVARMSFPPPDDRENRFSVHAGWMPKIAFRGRAAAGATGTVS